MVFNNISVRNAPSPDKIRTLVLKTCLSSRVQYVKTNKGPSSNISMNTAGPQVCDLSAFFFTLYTDNMSENSDHLKYGDDTIMIGFTKDNDENHYRNTIKYVTNWCSQNYLDLNITKTKELNFNFRRNQSVNALIVINDKAIDHATSYKFVQASLYTHTGQAPVASSPGSTIILMTWCMNPGCSVWLNLCRQVQLLHRI